MENAETLQEGALRETKEETQAVPKIIAPYTAFSLTHISQVHFFYLANLGDEKFGPTSESSEVKLFTKDEIPWDEIAFPTVTKTLKYYFDDEESSEFPFREEYTRNGIFQVCISFDIKTSRKGRRIFFSSVYVIFLIRFYGIPP